MKIRFPALAASLAVAVAVCLSAPARAQVDDYVFGLRALQDGHLEAAILALETYLNDQPEGPKRAEARFFLAEARYETGAVADALRDYRAFLAEYPRHPFSATAHFRVGKVELANGRHEAAARHFAAVEGGPLEAQALYHLGQIKFRRKDWGATVEVLSRLLRRHPGSPWAARSRFALGMAHYKRGEDDLVLKHLGAYLKAARPGQAGYLWANAVVGDIRKGRGACVAARGNFEAVLRGDPRFFGREAAAWGLAECAYLEKNYPVAAEKYARYLETYPRSPRAPLARVRGGHSYLLAGRYPEALRLLRESAAGEVPSGYGPWVLAWTARALELSGEKDEALAAYEELTAAYPGSSQAFDAAAKAASLRFAREDFEKALAHLAVLRKAPDPVQREWAARMAGEAEFALGRYEEAFASFSRALPQIREEGARRETLRKLGVSAFRAGKDKDALRHLSRWLKETEGSEDRGREDLPGRRLAALKMLAAVQTRLGLLKDLADTWGRLEAETPEDSGNGATAQKAEFAANRGLVLFRLGKFEAAGRQFREWRSRYPREKGRAEVLLHLGLAEARTGRSAEAARVLDAFLEEFPDHPRARDALYASALAHLRADDAAKAAQRLEGWLEGAEEEGESGRVKEARFLLAGARFESADWKGAAAAYHEILKRYPRDGRREAVLQKLTAAYGRLGEQKRPDEAFRWLEERYPDPGVRGEIFLRLGRERLLQKKGDEGLHYLRLAVRSPDSRVRAEGFYRLATLHVRREKYREALEALAQIPESAREGAEWSADADYLRGVAYEGQKEWDRAVEAYRVAARNTPSPAVARAALDRIAKIESLRWNP